MCEPWTKPTEKQTQFEVGGQIHVNMVFHTLINAALNGITVMSEIF